MNQPNAESTAMEWERWCVQAVTLALLTARLGLFERQYAEWCATKEGKTAHQHNKHFGSQPCAWSERARHIQRRWLPTELRQASQKERTAYWWKQRKEEMT